MKSTCTQCGQPFEAKGNLDLSRPPVCPACMARPKTMEVNVTERVSFDDREPQDQRLKEREVRG